MEGVFAIIGIFGSVPILVLIVYYFRSKAHARVTVLLGQMIDKGEVITPETVRALGIRAGTPHGDLKVGMILIAIAAAFMVFGQVIPDDEAPRVMMGVASFPFLVGATLIAFWYFVGRKSIDG